MQNFKQYFPNINEDSWMQLEALASEVRGWNEKINLISRKNIDELEARHILPSLAMSRVISFLPDAHVLDVGSGGGFPGLPLAICFPETHFTLVDSIGKKTRVIQSIADALELKNVRVINDRIENYKKTHDFVIGRAVTALPRFIDWVKKNISKHSRHSMKNGILYLKGGDYEEELRGTKIQATQTFQLSSYFDGAYCEDKCLIYFEKSAL